MQLQSAEAAMTATAEAASHSLGRVVSVRGSRASVKFPAASPGTRVGTRPTVGKFLGIHTGASLLIGVITDIALEAPGVANAHEYHAIAQVELVGEIAKHGTASAHFQRGVAEYPAIADPVALLGTDELPLIFNVSNDSAIDVGHLQQETTTRACIDVNDMLSKHFAVLGTTGVGKSSGIAIILHEVLRTRPDLRIFVLDVHNEYARSFGERAQVVNPRNLRLPFWLFTFEEIVDVFFGGRPGLEDEVDILAEVIPLAKSSYNQSRGSALIKRGDPKTTGYTADTPVPYRLADLIALLDDRMGKLENRSLRMIYHRLIGRIETVRNDPRYAFMFENANVGGDTMAEVLALLFRLPPDGKPMTIMQLSGFPSEVVDAVVSVITRMAFDFGLWSDGAAPLLFMCEEAHRYASADHTVGFGPTRRSISRIAKEGRKYGVFLGLVTQRPAELDATILSQCSTLFAMRMTNDRDQALLRSAVSDAAADLLGFLPSLGTREVLVFGEGVALPTRFKFTELPPRLLPRSESIAVKTEDPTPRLSHEFIGSVLERWRGATTTQRQRPDEGGPDARGQSEVEAAPSIVTYVPEPGVQILRKPLADIHGSAQPAGSRLRTPIK
jgi:DNA helicase HerA-like ATPase